MIRQLVEPSLAVIHFLCIFMSPMNYCGGVLACCSLQVCGYLFMHSYLNVPDFELAVATH